MAVTFVVEDGTGKSNATSYISEADADQYVEDYVVDSTDWGSASSAEKEQALNIGTRFIDKKYGARFQGTATDDEQSLQFPRYGVYDDNGFYIDSDLIPLELKQAVVEIAVHVIGGGDAFPDMGDAGGLEAKKIKVDVITIERKWSGNSSRSRAIALVESLMSEFLGTSGANAPLRRG